jgi:hypothetical protein
VVALEFRRADCSLQNAESWTSTRLFVDRYRNATSKSLIDYWPKERVTAHPLAGDGLPEAQKHPFSAKPQQAAQDPESKCVKGG